MQALTSYANAWPWSNATNSWSRPFFTFYTLQFRLNRYIDRESSQMLSAYFQSLFAFSQSATPIRRLSYLATISAMEKNRCGFGGMQLRIEMGLLFHKLLSTPR